MKKLYLFLVLLTFQSNVFAMKQYGNNFWEYLSMTAKPIKHYSAKGVQKNGNFMFSFSNIETEKLDKKAISNYLSNQKKEIKKTELVSVDNQHDIAYMRNSE